jgi:hypothetical protein
MTSLIKWFGPKVLAAMEVVNGVGLKAGRFIGALPDLRCRRWWDASDRVLAPITEPL